MKTLLAGRRLLLTVILAFAAAPYFINLGASSLWDSNEAFYAETPREMIESGDYLNPSFNYRPRFNKPPLSYWAVAAAYNTFGVSETSERLPIALGAVILIAVAFGVGRVASSVEGGLLAAIALAIAPRFLMFSRRIIIDVYVAMFMGLTLLFFTLAEHRPRRRRLYLTLMYVSVGLGVLTKGPVAAALPALAFLIYFALTRSLGRLREMMLPAGAAIVAAIVLPWYIGIYMEHGWLYIESFILKDNISRYTQPVWGPRRGVFFYLPVMLGDMFPWSVLLPPALWLYFRDRRRPGDRTGVQPQTLLVIWVAVILIFFSLSRNKEDLYIMPSYAAAAALVGALLARFTQGGGQADVARPVRWAMALLSAIILMTGAGMLYLFDNSLAVYKLSGEAAIGCILLVGGLAGVLLLLMKKDFAAVAATAITLAALNWVFVVKTLPDFERYKPVRAACQAIKARAAPDAEVGYYRFASPSMVFYLERQVFEFYQREELEAVLASGREVYCLMTAADYEAVKESLPVPTYILASYPVFQVKLRGIFDKAEIPQVVLISNRSGISSSG